MSTVVSSPFKLGLLRMSNSTMELHHVIFHSTDQSDCKLLVMLLHWHGLLYYYTSCVGQFIYTKRVASLFTSLNKTWCLQRHFHYSESDILNKTFPNWCLQRHFHYSEKDILNSIFCSFNLQNRDDSVVVTSCRHCSSLPDQLSTWNHTAIDERLLKWNTRKFNTQSGFIKV